MGRPRALKPTQAPRSRPSGEVAACSKLALSPRSKSPGGAAQGPLDRRQWALAGSSSTLKEPLVGRPRALKLALALLSSPPGGPSAGSELALAPLSSPLGGATAGSFFCPRTLGPLDGRQRAPHRNYQALVYGQHFQQSMDQPGLVPNPACGQLNSENEYFPVPVRAFDLDRRI